MIFKPDIFTIRSTSGTSDVTFINGDGTSVITVITEDNLVDFDAETFIFIAGQNNTNDIVISIDGETSTLSTATSLSLLSTNRDSFYKYYGNYKFYDQPMN